ncbi:MAG: hypothetical protein LBQ54_16410, partial [Planctomycetaceae bacterium]|nr:hypothetical protein [Planctomycetaceae bacterium]
HSVFKRMPPAANARALDPQMGLPSRTNNPFALLTGINRRNKRECSWKEYLTESEPNEVSVSMPTAKLGGKPPAAASRPDLRHFKTTP